MLKRAGLAEHEDPLIEDVLHVVAPAVHQFAQRRVLPEGTPQPFQLAIHHVENDPDRQVVLVQKAVGRDGEHVWLRGNRNLKAFVRTDLVWATIAAVRVTCNAWDDPGLT